MNGGCTCGNDCLACEVCEAPECECVCEEENEEKEEGLEEEW